MNSSINVTYISYHAHLKFVEKNTRIYWYHVFLVRIQAFLLLALSSYSWHWLLSFDTNLMYLLNRKLHLGEPRMTYTIPFQRFMSALNRAYSWHWSVTSDTCLLLTLQYVGAPGVSSARSNAYCWHCLLLALWHRLPKSQDRLPPRYSRGIPFQ